MGKELFKECIRGLLLIVVDKNDGRLETIAKEAFPPQQRVDIFASGPVLQPRSGGGTKNPPTLNLNKQIPALTINNKIK